MFGVQTAKASWLINNQLFATYREAADVSLNGKPLFPMLLLFRQTPSAVEPPEFLIKSSVAPKQMRTFLRHDTLAVLFSPFVMGDGDVELLKATPRETDKLTDNWRKSPPGDDDWHDYA